MSGCGITREGAMALVKKHISEQVLIKHCLATEAIMRSLAGRFGEDPETWGIAGLLHDLDYAETKDTPARHTLVTETILRENGVCEEIIAAIKSHNAEAIGIERTERFHFALTAAENVTGLIVATALVQPDKKIAQVKPSSVVKRMKEKSFARSVSREGILLCEQIGMPLDQFVTVGLEAMGSIASELGL
jgi:putative nucleotidyltransferase with HDIG domain